MNRAAPEKTNIDGEAITDDTIRGVLEQAMNIRSAFRAIKEEFRGHDTKFQ